MMKALKKVNWKKLGIFAGGVLFGTAGIKVLSSKDAKNVYTHCTAGVLRAKDCVMKTANTIQENCGDIYAGAKDINEARVELVTTNVFIGLSTDENFILVLKLL